jgi:predicted dehydrogenase
MSTPQTRRTFLKQTAFSTAGLWLLGSKSSAGPRRISPNDKLNIGVIGVANRGGDNLNGVSGENIVALCDIDDKYLAAAAQRFPSAKTYNDFRRLLDQKDIDAVVLSTPDHTHAVATVRALKSGRHVYCEKPLTRTVSEARIVTETARKHERVTQIGTQIHAGTNYRRVVELVQSGAIGTVRDVHVWVNASYGKRERPKESKPVPENIHYALWLGPAEYRPYHPDYLPFNWRHWWAFGGGALADFGCHYMDLPHWALDLRHPLAVEVVDGPPVHAESTPPWLIVRYEHPARGSQPPVNVTWYHGGKRPEVLPSLVSEEQLSKWPSGVLFIGQKGMVMSDYNKHVLLPEKDFADFVRSAPFIKDSIGHHKEWIQACKTGGPTTCNFDYSGPLSETALLGNVAYRVGKRLEWDAKKLRAKNCREADRYIQHHYRKGWKLA